jgi:hypothetical protein
MGVQVVSAKMEANPTDSLKTIDAFERETVPCCQHRQPSVRTRRPPRESVNQSGPQDQSGSHDLWQICSASKIKDVNVVENIVAIKLCIWGWSEYLKKAQWEGKRLTPPKTNNLLSTVVVTWYPRAEGGLPLTVLGSYWRVTAVDSIKVRTLSNRHMLTKVKKDNIIPVCPAIMTAHDEEIPSNLRRGVRKSLVRELKIESGPSKSICQKHFAISNGEPQHCINNPPRCKHHTSEKYSLPSLPPTTIIMFPTKLAVWYPLGAGGLPVVSIRVQ